MASLSEMSFLEIRIPRESEETPEAMVALFANLPKTSVPFLSGLFSKKSGEVFSFEIAVYEQTIRFFVAVPKIYQSYFESQLTAQYPNSIVIPATNYLPSWTDGGVAFGNLVFTEPFYFPLRTYKDFKEVDPLASVLGIMAKANQGEKMLVQIVIETVNTNWQGVGRQVIARGIPTGEEGKVSPHPQAKIIETKISQVGFRTGIRLLVVSPNESESESLLRSLAGSFGNFTNADGNSLALKKPIFFNREKLKNAILERSFDQVPNQYFTISELATIFHFPSVSLSAIRNIAWGRQMTGEPPSNLPIALDLTDEEKRTINFFARTEFKNKLSIFGIKKEDRRKHVYIVGKTGTGKSTLIANMAINDIRNNEGMAIIDPHGDLSELLLDYVPTYRINDVVFLDPSSQTGRTFHLNPLEVKNPAHRELIASGIVSIFYKLYSHSWGPRLEYILRNTILTLVSKQGSTLLEVPLILSNDSYRQRIVDRLTDQVLKNFWTDEYNKMSPNLRSEAISPILNKVGQFLSSSTIRNIIGAPESTIDLEDVMNNGKVLIMNLSQGRLGEDNSALLGAMLITKLQLAAMNRVNVLEHARRDFYLYVDEFQNFATNSFIKILSEARKYRLNLTLANQYTAQVDEDVQKAIFGNVGTLITFLVGADDSRVLSKEFGGVYEEDDLVSLGNYQIVLKLAIDNLTSTPFPAFTLPLPKSRTQSREKILRVSGERYTRPIETETQQITDSEQKQPMHSQETKKRQENFRTGYVGSQGNQKVSNPQHQGPVVQRQPFTGRGVVGQGTVGVSSFPKKVEQERKPIHNTNQNVQPKNLPETKNSESEVEPVIPLAGPSSSLQKK